MEEAESSFDNTPPAAPAPRRSAAERLVAQNELERHEGLQAILGAEQAEFVQALPGLPAAERRRIFAALWEMADVLLIEGRERARPIFASACAQEDPGQRELWRQLMSFYRPADPAAPLEAGRVAAALAAAPAAERRAFARALLIHPAAEVRALARGEVEPADCWQAVIGAGTSWRILAELWQFMRGGPPGLLKIFLFALAGRFLGEVPREQLATVARLFLSALEVEALQERPCRQLLLRIDQNLRQRAAAQGIALGEDPAYARRVGAFSEAPVAAELPIPVWDQVPLPVQRTLARRGVFPRHFCCHPTDAVALECFPLLVRRPDFVEFLKLPTINARLLAQLAEEKQLYESDAAKFFLVANPRCPFHTIGKYLGYLTSESLTKLSQGYVYNSFARKQAERLLEQRGKAKKGPEPASPKGRR